MCCARLADDGCESIIGLAAVELRQLLECGDEALLVHALLLHQVERVVVGRAFLRLRELRIDELLGDVAELRARQCRHARRCRAGRGARRADRVGRLHRLLRVPQGDVAHFMADHAAQLVVVHLVHQAAVHAHAAVAHRPRVDVLGHVDLVVDLLAVQRHVAEALHHLRQALRIRAVRRRDLRFGIARLARVVRQCGDVAVRQRRCLVQAGPRRRQAVRVKALHPAARAQQKRHATRCHRFLELHPGIPR